MQSKDELKEIIKNCTFYYYENTIKDGDIYFRYILLDKKLYENISVYHISCRTSTGPKPLRIRLWWWWI